MGNRLLVAPLPLPGRDRAAPAPGVVLGRLGRADAEAVGRTYWEVYGGADGETTLAEAVGDVVLALDGGHGTPIPDACVVARADGDVVGAVLCVLDPPWPDVPRGPFVVDLFVAATHRRRGVGAALLVAACAAAPGDHVGLRVEDDAAPARALYARLGFVEAVPS